jgi:hypothetical protein
MRFGNVTDSPCSNLRNSESMAGVTIEDPRSDRTASGSHLGLIRRFYEFDGREIPSPLTATEMAAVPNADARPSLTHGGAESECHRRDNSTSSVQAPGWTDLQAHQRVCLVPIFEKTTGPAFEIIQS